MLNGTQLQGCEVKRTADLPGAELRAQAGLHCLLGRLLEQEPDPQLLRLIRGGLRAPLAAVGMVLEPGFFEAPEAALLDELAEEYTGLLVAPGGVSPYLSVFETGCLYREPCDRVYAAYREAGWDYRRAFSGEFPDHIGTMIAFAGSLFAAEADASAQGDAASAAASARERNRFLLELLGPWGPGWCRRAAPATLHPFYRQAIALTEQVLWDDLAALTDRRGLRKLAGLNQRDPARLDYDADFRKASGI